MRQLLMDDLENSIETAHMLGAGQTKNTLLSFTDGSLQEERQVGRWLAKNCYYVSCTRVWVKRRGAFEKVLLGGVNR